MANKKKQTHKKTKQQSISQQLIYEIIGFVILALLILAVAKLGFVGHFIHNIFQFFTGSWTIFFIIGLLWIAISLIWRRQWPVFWSRRMFGCYLFSFAVLVMVHTFFYASINQSDNSIIGYTWSLYWQQLQGAGQVDSLGGGLIGALGLFLFHLLFATTGTIIVSIILMIVAAILITDQSFGVVLSKLASKSNHVFKKQKQRFQEKSAARRAAKQEKTEETTQRLEVIERTDDHEQKSGNEAGGPVIHDFAEDDKTLSTPVIDGNHNDTVNHEGTQSGAEEGNTDRRQEHTGSTEDNKKATSLRQTEQENKDYKLPPLSLFHLPEKNKQSTQRQFIQENTRKLERTFESFGVSAKIRNVHLGPAVTKYEVYPDVGVKVSKIVSLHDDIALALAAKDIRIEAPIPGKSAVGIEVPNQDVSMVSLREVLESKEAQKATHKLSIGLGRDISGEAVLANLSAMPHLLVAGSTGSGKSVCINAIVTSILTKAKPHEVKLMMIDPKMVELNVYNGIPHLLTPVVVDPKKASQALKKIVSEMEQRYELFSDSGTRNIEAYNAWLKQQPEDVQDKKPFLPYIVVIVDELADLMMVASKEVEDSITRLSQMARAAGIHMILATQRPSVDVITGVVKANIPSRIAFNVSSQTDSRTILDAGGADKLLGKGDMLFLPVGSSKPTRIQGVFLSDEEVEGIVDYVISQQKAQYEEDMMPSEETQETVDVEDEYYHEAVKLIVSKESASVSMLQRRFRIGYTRAARLVDAMEANGIVGPSEGSKPRKVLISQAETESESAEDAFK